MQKKSALIVGASGLVGGELLKVLLESVQYDRVTIFVRNPLTLKHQKLKEVIVDFENLPLYQEYMKVDDVYCCLGTTIKKAGTKEAFKRVDVDYPLELAKLAKRNSVKQFMLISAIGADTRSKVFYSRMKGIVEEKISGLELKSLHIFRPSLLLGDRKEFRLGEAISAKITRALPFVFIGPLRKYKPVDARDVALSMYHVAISNKVGNYIYESDEIDKIDR